MKRLPGPCSNDGPSPSYTATLHGQSEEPPRKRQRLPLAKDVRTPRRGSEATVTTPRPSGAANHGAGSASTGNVGQLPESNVATEGSMAGHATAGSGGPSHVVPEPPSVPTAKSRRVRTGCLTCRERHLKCDEAAPDCMNCRRSNRECKRGVRLNFIDTQVKSPPFVPQTTEWSVEFQDESRQIASEYQGGLGRYGQADMQNAALAQLGVLVGAQSQPQQGWEGLGPDSLESALSARPSQAQSVYGLSAGPIDGAHHVQQVRRNNEVLPAMSADPTPTTLLTARQSAMEASVANLQEQYGPRPGPATGHWRGRAYSTGSSLTLQNLAASSSTTSSDPLGPGTIDVREGDGLSASDNTTSDRDYLHTDEDMYYMQMFIDEVALWMDSMDPHTHFSRVIPFLALRSPMLLSATLACGAKHVAQARDPAVEDKAASYYHAAMDPFQMTLRNPNRNTAELTITAVVLNVYQTMSEKPDMRMNHIAGARALIRECGWNASTPGIGAACFWLNIGMEVISCLSFDWHTAWDPDQWGLDMTPLYNMPEEGKGGGDATDGGRFGPYGAGNTNTNGDESLGNMSLAGEGDEEVWVHRIFYIVARVANFRASVPRFQQALAHDELLRQQKRTAEWDFLAGLCAKWNGNCPRTMKPCGYMPAGQGQSRSAFPKVWLIKRSAIVGRLFYHTAMCLLAQVNPNPLQDQKESRRIQLYHAHQVCGIVAHTDDHGICSVAIRSTAIAGEVLTDPREQEEVLQILERIRRDTGWQLGKVLVALKQTWAGPRASTLAFLPGVDGMGTSAATGRASYGTQKPPPQQQHQHRKLGGVAATTAEVSAPAPWRPVIHPLLVSADFSLPNHPYVGFYEPPNRPPPRPSPQM